MAGPGWSLAQTIETYLDGFNKLDRAQILSSLTDDIEWAVFGAYRVSGKQAYAFVIPLTQNDYK